VAVVVVVVVLIIHQLLVVLAAQEYLSYLFQLLGIQQLQLAHLV
jgi:hypothetical protein